VFASSRNPLGKNVRPVFKLKPEYEALSQIPNRLTGSASTIPTRKKGIHRSDRGDVSFLVECHGRPCSDLINIASDRLDSAILHECLQDDSAETLQVVLASFTQPEVVSEVAGGSEEPLSISFQLQ
jgi:hypothetical protein